MWSFVPLLILAPGQPELCTPRRLVHAHALHGGGRDDALVVPHVRRPCVLPDLDRSRSRYRLGRTAPTMAFVVMFVVLFSFPLFVSTILRVEFVVTLVVSISVCVQTSVAMSFSLYTV